MPEPKFIPKPGQTDYTDIRYAPVINIVVTHDGKVLLTRRSPGMRLYPDCWNGISGFLDDQQDISDKACEELLEELGIKREDIVDLRQGQVLLQEAPEYHKTWLVVPILASIGTLQFKLNWEASSAQWFLPSGLKKLNLMPGFNSVLAQFFPEVL